MAEKREDETLLEYLLRLAREGMEGYGELSQERLRKSQERKRGLMPDWDVNRLRGEYEKIDQIPSIAQDSLLPSQTMTQPIDTSAADRAAIEQTIGQRTPRALREIINQGVPGMTVNPETGRTPGEDDLIMGWSGSGQAPLEPAGLMQQDLEQTRAKEQAELYDQVTPGPITPRVPAADLDLSPIPSVPGVGDPTKETDLETSLVDKYRESTQGFLNKILPDPEGAMDKTLKGAEGFLDKSFFEKYFPYGSEYNPEVEGPLKQVTSETLGTVGDVGKGLWNMVLEPYVGGAARAIEAGWTGKDVPSDKYIIKQEPFLGREHFRQIIGQETTKDWKDAEIATFSDISDALFPETEKQKIDFNLDDFDPSIKKTDTGKILAENAKKDKSKVRAADKKPTIGGQFSGKSPLYSLAGVPKDVGAELDRIDSTYKTMSLIAMMGGAGESRAAENYRKKSLQRLRLESDLDERAWERAYKLATTNIVTWYYYDPSAGVEPINLYVGQNPGSGYQQTKPTQTTGDIDWARLDKIMGEDDWTDDKFTMAIYEYINQSPGLSSMLGSFPDQAVEIASIPVLARFRKASGGKYWTASDKARLRAAIEAGNKEEVKKMIKDKKEFPEGMREELDKFFLTLRKPSRF